MNLPNSLKTLSISASAEGRSWERQLLLYDLEKSFVHSNQISTYITLRGSRNLFDLVFAKLNALKRHLLETGTARNH